MKMFQLFFAFAVVLACSVSVSGQEKSTTDVAQVLNAPPPSVTDIRPDAAQSGATMPAVNGPVAVPAALAVPPLKKKMGGRWRTVTNMQSQTWSLHDIDQKNGTARLDWWGYSQGSCRVTDVLVTIEKYDGTNLKFGDKKAGCLGDFSADLKRDGEKFAGEINLDIPAGAAAWGHTHLLGTLE